MSNGISFGDKSSARYIPYLYNRVKQYIQSLTINSSLTSSRDVVSIPAEYNGADPDFSQSGVDFLVYYGGANVSPNWTISVLSTNNCTVLQAGNTVTITSITGDTASYTMRADRTDYTTLTRTIQVNLMPKGQDGAGAPDNETIVLTGGNNLKVRKHEYYDDAGDLENSVLIGEGALSGRTVGSIAAENNISIIPGTGENTAFNSGVDCVNIGKSNVLGGSFGRLVNNIISIGHDLFVHGKQTVHTNNAIVVGNATPTGSPEVTGDYTVSLGCDPKNPVSESVSISYPSFSPFGQQTNLNNTIFAQRSVLGPTATPVNVAINLSDADVGITGAEFFVKIDVTIFGLDTSGSEYYTDRDVLVINDATGIVATNNIAAEKYESGSLAPASHAHVWSGTTLTTTMTPAGTLANIVQWFVNYKIDVIGI